MNLYYCCLVLWLFTNEVTTFPNKLLFSSSLASSSPHQTGKRNHWTEREVEEKEPDFEIIDLSIPSWDDVTNCIDCDENDVTSRHVLSQKRMERLSVRPSPIWSMEQSGSGDGDMENSNFNNQDFEDEDTTMQTATEKFITSKYRNQHFKPALSEVRHVQEIHGISTNAMSEFVSEGNEATLDPLSQEKSTHNNATTASSEFVTRSPKIVKDFAENDSPAEENEVRQETKEKLGDAQITSPLTTEDSSRTVGSNKPTHEATTLQFTSISTKNEEPIFPSTPVTPNYCNVSKENVFIRLNPTSVTVEEGHNATIQCQVFLNALTWPEPFIEWRFMSASGHKCTLGPRSQLYDTCSYEETRKIEQKNASISVLTLQMLTTNQTGLYECSVSWECGPEVGKESGAQTGNLKRAETQQSLLLRVFDKPYYVYQISAISGLGVLLLGLLVAFCFLKSKHTNRTKVLYSVQSTECEKAAVSKAVLEKKHSQFSQASFVSDEEDDEGD